MNPYIDIYNFKFCRLDFVFAVLPKWHVNFLNFSAFKTYNTQYNITTLKQKYKIERILQSEITLKQGVIL